jgi:pimeloyl-ACP methyl ester carboxylesterase
MMFFPPTPPMYAHYKNEDVVNKSGQVVQTVYQMEGGERVVASADTPHFLDPVMKSPNFKLSYVDTKYGSTICCLFICNPGTTTTIFFSHANATDLGSMRDHFISIADICKVNIFAYDYTGYGLSTGKPAPRHLIADAEAAFDYMKRTYPASCERVIAYGQSLGSAAACHISIARSKDVHGTLIHCGFASSLRVLRRSMQQTYFFDPFPNSDLARDIKNPLMVIHGTEDEEVPIENGLMIARNAQNPYRQVSYKDTYGIVGVRGAGHNNIDMDFKVIYFQSLLNFVRFIEQK